MNLHITPLVNIQWIHKNQAGELQSKPKIIGRHFKLPHTIKSHYK